MIKSHENYTPNPFTVMLLEHVIGAYGITKSSDKVFIKCINTIYHYSSYNKRLRLMKYFVDGDFD